MADLFSTNVLARVVADLRAPASFLLDRFFGEVQTETSEEIHFDVENKKRRLAPFVSPVVAGKVVQSNGFTTSTFKPAYVKDKRVFDAGRPLKRSAGEQIGGSLDPMERMQRLLAQELSDQLDMLTRRMEVMAAEALRTGGVTITGDMYPTVNVNFGRAGANTITLAGAARWGQAGIKPLDLLQDWALAVAKASGSKPTEVIMDVDAWKVFSADTTVQKLLDRFRGRDELRTVAALGEGGNFMGSVGDFDIYLYAGWYIDDAGNEQPILPSGTVLMGSGQIEGVRAFGAIRDEEAGYQALPYFPKSWVEKDPAVRILLMQSAPLVVPYRVNASLAATVL